MLWDWKPGRRKNFPNLSIPTHRPTRFPVRRVLGHFSGVKTAGVYEYSRPPTPFYCRSRVQVVPHLYIPLCFLRILRDSLYLELYPLEQACSTFSVVRGTSEKMFLHTGNKQFGTNDKELINTCMNIRVILPVYLEVTCIKIC